MVYLSFAVNYKKTPMRHLLCLSTAVNYQETSARKIVLICVRFEVNHKETATYMDYYGIVVNYKETPT